MNTTKERPMFSKTKEELKGDVLERVDSLTRPELMHTIKLITEMHNNNMEQTNSPKIARFTESQAGNILLKSHIDSKDFKHLTETESPNKSGEVYKDGKKVTARLLNPIPSRKGTNTYWNNITFKGDIDTVKSYLSAQGYSVDIQKFVPQEQLATTS